MNKDKAYISIPRGLCLTIANDSNALKAMSVFFQLKSLYVGGTIHSFNKRIKEFSSSFGISQRTLYSYIKQLKSLGLVSINAKGTLVLISSNKVAAKYDVSDKKFHKVLTTNLKQLHKILMALAIQECLVRQMFKLKKKVIAKQIEKHLSEGNTTAVKMRVSTTTLTNNNIQPAYQKKLRKVYSRQFDRLLANTQKRYTDSISNLQIPDLSIFPYVTLSRQGIANLFGKTSKTTGSRYAKKLATLGFILDERTTSIKVMENATWDDYINLQLHVVEHDYSYRYDYLTNTIFKLLPNEVSFNTDNILL
jgi:DNA-binding transcriptional ArsR family regulator